MGKKNQLEAAIEHLEAEKAVIQMAIDKLKAAQTKAPLRKSRALKAVKSEAASA